MSGQRHEVERCTLRHWVDLLHHGLAAQLGARREADLGALQRRSPGHERLVACQVNYPRRSSTIASGLIKAYAIAASERNPALQKVPTTREAGLPEFRVSAGR
jgi:hypothetical protein